MKKLVAILLSALIVFSLSSCRGTLQSGVELEGVGFDILEWAPTADVLSGEPIPMFSQTLNNTMEKLRKEKRYDQLVYVMYMALPIDQKGLIAVYIASESHGPEAVVSWAIQENDGILTPSGVATMVVYTPAMKSLPWLASTILHEYKHYLDAKSGYSPEEFKSHQHSLESELRAYFCELYNAQKTGLSELFIADIKRRITILIANMLSHEYDAAKWITAALEYKRG